MTPLSEQNAQLLREILVGLILGFIVFGLIGIGYVWGYNASHKASDEVISMVIEDNPDYYLDVLCETDAWENYSK